MSHSSSQILRPTLTLTAALLLCSSAMAANFPFRENLNQDSLSRGLGRAAVPLLQRQAGPGAQAVLNELLLRYRNSNTSISTSGNFKEDVNPKRIRLTGDAGWSLQVFGDGSAIRYRNDAYLQSPANPLRPLEQRLSNEELERLGRAFISRELGSLVTLAQGEALVAYSTLHEINAVKQNVANSQLLRDVVSSQVNFSRTVGGVSIVGPGSKVSVIFANDGTPVGFDLDWPSYSNTGQNQPVLNVEGIKQRATTLLGLDPFTAADTEVRRFECGYFDAGARQRDPKALVQSACYLQYVIEKVVDETRNRQNPTDGLQTTGIAEPIPAGVNVSVDLSWPAALQLCRNAPNCGVLPPVLTSPPNAGSLLPNLPAPGGSR